MTGHRGTLTDRFLAKLLEDRDPDQCWIWQGKPSRKGYGRINEGGADGQILLAHRVSYEVFVGPISDGLHVDHRCHTDAPDCVDWANCPHRMCVNPAHLEPVAPGVNTLRGHGLTVVTFVTGVCQRGHDYAANVYVHPKTGKGQCKECARVRRTARSAA